MSKIEELIEQFCPGGVEFRTLGEVFKISRGRVMSKEYLRDYAGDYPVYSSQTANNGEIGKIRTFDYDGEYLTWTTDGANAGTIFYRKGKFSITNVCGLLKAKVTDFVPRFVFYVLGTIMQNSVSSGMGNPKLMSNVVEKIHIPIPPLPIQQEIVTILDNFTQLEAELEAELEARKRQYEYYRNQLLNFEGKEVEWKTLGEVCEKIISGKNTIKSNDGEYPVYGSTGIIGRSNYYVYENNCILIARVGANAGFVYKAVGKYDVSDNTLIIRPKDNYDLSFAYFQLLNLDLNKYAVGGGQPLITASLLAKLSIPIPPLAEQKRIVTILDKFDALVNDISVGLPAEIQARRKQYEYYRGKLLDFKNINNG